jgi:DNA-binding IclR family transcriptional regulator
VRKRIKQKLTAIEKTLEIIGVFSESKKELGTVEVSELTGFHKATTSRILATLADYGLLTQEGKNKKFNLGPLSYKLGASTACQAIQALVDVSKPRIDSLRDKINETISFEVWTGNSTIACYLAESRNLLRVSMVPADVLPLHAPAGSKAILSFLCVGQINKLINDKHLGDELESYCENTITSKEELHRKLVEYNKQGYSIDNEELHPGIYAIGVPVFDYLCKPIAALVAVMPVTRVTDARVAEIVCELRKTSKFIAEQVNQKRSLFPYHASN